MFFNKKYHKLNRELLAKAIAVYLKIEYLETDEEDYTNKEILLNDVFKIKVSHVRYYYGCNCYFMSIKTYVEEIKMAEYEFTLYVDENKELNAERIDTKANIIHYMPNQFIDLMNDWSKQIVEELKKERNEKTQKEEALKKEKHDKEESVLKKYR